VNKIFFIAVLSIVAILGISVGLGMFIGWSIHPDTKIIYDDSRYNQIPLPDGRSIVVDKNSTVKVEMSGKEGVFFAKDGGLSSSIGVKSYAQKIDEKLKFDSPKLSIRTVWALLAGEGGSTSYAAQLLGNSGAALSLIIIGAILIAGGVVILIWLKSGVGWALIAAGIILIVVSVIVDQYPWVLLVVGILGVAAVVYVIYMKYGKITSTVVTGEIVDTGQKFKDLIAASKTLSQAAKDEVIALYKQAGDMTQGDKTQKVVKANK
jgi:hypothetical protein